MIKKIYMFNNIQPQVFKCKDLVSILIVSMCTSVKTSTGTKKCEFYAKKKDLRITNGLRHFDTLQKNLPEDGVDKRRNATKLQSD